jgi:hypothetical protein
MVTNKAVNKDESADRPSRPTPTHREPVSYNCVEARGVTSPDTTKPQFERAHEFASSKDATKAGAIIPGEVGLANAKRRTAHVMSQRKATEAIFDSHRKSAPGYPYSKNSKFKS